MFNNTKTKIQNFFIKPRSIKPKALLASILLIAIYCAGFWGWANVNDSYAMAEVNVPKVVEDNRTIKEHVFSLLIDECQIPFDEVVSAMAMIERCENPSWDEFDWNINSPTKGCPNGSVDWGIWMINDCYQLKNFDSRSELVRCATDTYCATRYACRLYREWGNSWEAWTCGR